MYMSNALLRISWRSFADQQLSFSLNLITNKSVIVSYFILSRRSLSNRVNKLKALSTVATQATRVFLSRSLAQHGACFVRNLLESYYMYIYGIACGGGYSLTALTLLIARFLRRVISSTKSKGDACQNAHLGGSRRVWRRARAIARLKRPGLPLPMSTFLILLWLMLERPI